MITPKLAIGMPVFNGERWLADTLESVLAQSYQDFELVISDNASTDGTEAICKAYANKDERINYYRNLENVGIFRNFDLVFSRSNSQYFKWWAIGDSCEKSFLAKCVCILDEEEDVVLVHSRTVLFAESPKSKALYEQSLNLIDENPANRFRDFLERATLNNVMNGVIRSDALRKTSLNQLYLSSDLCMIAELLLQGKAVELSEPLFFRRMQADTSTARKTTREKVSFFSNEPKNVMKFSKWKFEISLAKGIYRAPISWLKKAGLWIFVLKRAFWKRRELFKEISVSFTRHKSRYS